MNRTIQARPDVVLFAIEGRFDAHDAPKVRQQLDDAIDDGAVRLVVDLSAVTFIDSTALAELVRCMKHARQVGGDLLLCDPSNPVRVILELTRLDQALPIVSRDELEGAVTS